jgi:hypothetical protein
MREMTGFAAILRAIGIESFLRKNTKKFAARWILCGKL